jgi:hypothetical protein
MTKNVAEAAVLLLTLRFFALADGRMSSNAAIRRANRRARALGPLDG